VCASALRTKRPGDPGIGAATNPGLDVAQIALNAPKNLPSFDDTYQMHTGVLDTLRR
jgi:hypothetical protein